MIPTEPTRYLIEHQQILLGINHLLEIKTIYTCKPNKEQFCGLPFELCIASLGYLENYK